MSYSDHVQAINSIVIRRMSAKTAAEILTSNLPFSCLYNLYNSFVSFLFCMEDCASEKLEVLFLKRYKYFKVFILYC